MKSSVPVFFLKLSLSAALIYYALRKVDLNSAISEIMGMPVFVVIVVILLVLAAHYLGAIRLSLLLEALYKKITLGNAIKATIIGAFFSQTMVSIGGDAMRIWHLTRLDIPFKTASHGIILDRISGLVAMMSLIIICLPYTLNIIPTRSIQASLVLSITGGCIAIVGLLCISYLPQCVRHWKLLRWATDLSHSANAVLRKSKSFLLSFSCSIAIQFINVLAFFIIAKSISSDVSYFALLALIPPVIFLSMLPISIAGWGVRETAMVIVLGIYGMPSHQSVVISICYGLVALIVSIPGGIIFLLNRKHKILTSSVFKKM